MALRDSFRNLAAAEAAKRQNMEEGWWFGDGPQAGVVPDAEMRMLAVSTRNPEWTDIVCFQPTGGSPRSIYQRVTIPRVTIPRDAYIGIVELDLVWPSGQAYESGKEWLQVALYAADGTNGLPGTLLGRCVPVPLACLHSGNTQSFLLPLWEPVQVSADTNVWVCVSPRAYYQPIPGWETVQNAANHEVHARGNRESGSSDFVESDDVEPPLSSATWYSDRHLYVRLYEAPQSVTVAVAPSASTPKAPVGFRAVLDRPVRGRPESAYAAGLRPGYGTTPWNLPGGYYYTGGGGGTDNHNELAGLQGGTASEYYHVTEDEYAGTWQHQLIAFSSSNIPIQGHRTGSATDSYASGLFAKHITDQDMADGFGVGVAFAIEDDAGVENVIGRVGALRSGGADDTGDLVWWTANGGALNERMRLTASGRLGIGIDSPAAVLDAYLGNTSGSIARLTGGNEAEIIWNNLNTNWGTDESLVLQGNGVEKGRFKWGRAYNYPGLSNGDWYAEWDMDSAHIWKVGGAEQMRLTSAGPRRGGWELEPATLLRVSMWWATRASRLAMEARTVMCY